MPVKEGCSSTKQREFQKLSSICSRKGASCKTASTTSYGLWSRQDHDNIKTYIQDNHFYKCKKNYPLAFLKKKKNPYCSQMNHAIFILRTLLSKCYNALNCIKLIIKPHKMPKSVNNIFHTHIKSESIPRKLPINREAAYPTDKNVSICSLLNP